MTSKVVQTITACGFAAIGFFSLAGCEQSPPANNPTAVNPDSHPVTGEDVRREAGEAAHTTKEYLDQKQDEFSAKMGEKLAELDEKLARMKVEGEELKGEAKEKWDASMEELKVKREELSVKFEELKKSSGAAWEEMKAGLEKAGREIDHAFEDAKKKFKESTSSESTETPANP